MQSSPEELSPEELKKQLRTSRLLQGDRLRGSLTSIYQTMLGITQGGAIGYLIINSLSESKTGSYDFLQWLLVGLVFSVLVLVWYTVSLDTVCWTWIPGLFDAFILFGIGVYELIFVSTIANVPRVGLHGWLIWMSVGAIFQFAGFKYTIARAEKEDVNKPLLRDLTRDTEIRERNDLVCLIAFPCIALISFALPVGDLASANKVWIGIVMLAIIIGHVYCFYFNHSYFNSLIERARSAESKEKAAPRNHLNTSPENLDRQTRGNRNHRKRNGQRHS